MQKTSYYNLKKPESTDPLRVADFNENADRIDAALGSLNTAVAAGLRIETGSYRGTGTFGPDTSNTITFSITPKIVIIVMDAQTGSHPGALFLAGQQRSNGFGSNGGSSYGNYGLTLTWGENTLSWSTKYTSDNAADAYFQLNASGVTYRYVVIG